MERDLERLGIVEPNLLGMTSEKGVVREFKLPHNMCQSSLISAMRRDFDGLVAHLSSLSRDS